ncbi:MAG: DUF58 domain-containing protein [Proteobacteria bacterium]|nr:DUF58 domain-containing protein [Pseudomonadota bacterium]
MMVPTNRLILSTAVVVIPLAAMSIVFPSLSLMTLAAIAVFLLCAVIDAAMSRKRAEGIKVHFPERAYLLRARKGKIEFMVERKKSSLKKIRLALEFPAHFERTEEVLAIELPGDGEEFLFHWSCMSLKRGSHLFHRCFIETSSALAFWDVRSHQPVKLELRVYPNLMNERKNVAALFLNGSNLGIHSRRQIGQGKEFEKLREYIPGDSYDQIHWKATAKRGQPVSKVFQIERTQEVYVIVDASRLSARPLQKRGGTAAERQKKAEDYSDTMLEHCISSSLILGSIAQRQGDLFGLLTFSDKVHSFVRANSGREHFNTCRDALCRLQPQVVTPDFDELCSFIGLRLRRRALLIFLTNLDDPLLAESFERNVSILGQKHLVLVNMLNPPGVHPLFSNANSSGLDDLYKALGGHILWQTIMEFKKDLQRKGIGFSLLDSKTMSTEMVSQYMSVKQRQLI